MPEVCIACGSSNLQALFHVQTDRLHEVKSCRDCQVTATFPRATAEELKAFYDGSYFAKSSARVSGYSNDAGLIESNACEMWGWFSRFAPTFYSLKARMLDYGCATGGVLVEPRRMDGTAQGSSSPVMPLSSQFWSDCLGRRHLRFSTKPRVLEVVTMRHVFEHIISPVEVLKRTRELLSRNGYLFVELLSWSSLGRQLKLGKWKQLPPPEHIDFFTPQTGGNVNSLWIQSIYKAVSLYPSTNWITLRQNRPPADFAAGLCGYLLGSFGLGGYDQVLAQKTEKSLAN